MSASTVPIRYKVMCGRYTGSSDDELWQYHFVVDAPASLIDAPSNRHPHPDPEGVGRFIEAIVGQHNQIILDARAWTCGICFGPAKEIFHKVVPLLKGGDEVSELFKPELIDTAVPICWSGGECDRKAAEMVEKFWRRALPDQDFEMVKMCEHCGSVNTTKVCGGCKVIR